jgi:proteasome activator subunit 4
MADTRVSKKVVEAKKPVDRVQSLAEAIIYSMSHDAPQASTDSQAATPGTSTPRPQAVSRLQNGVKRTASGDSLAAAGQKGDEDRKYLGGSKALDHLSKLLTSCETVRKR